MPIDVQDIAKQAEVSHSTVLWALKYHLAIAHQTVERLQRFARALRHVDRIADCFDHKVQGGLENVAHSSTIDNSFFTAVYRHKAGVHVSTVIYYRAVLSHLISDDHVNAMSVEAALA